MEILLFTICSTLILFQVTPANTVPFIVELIKKRDASSICTDGCPLGGYQVIKDCCEEGSTCTEYCEECIDGTYFTGGRYGFCDSCDKCENGEKVLEVCTTENNTVCSGCESGYFRHPSNNCLPCSECSGEVYCDVCSSTPKASTTPTKEHSSGRVSTVMTTPQNVRATTSSAILSTEAPDDEPQTTRAPTKSQWKTEYLIPLLLSPVLLIAALGLAIKMFCCWTDESKTFWIGYFPCCRRCCNASHLSPTRNGSSKSPGDEANSNICCNWFSRIHQGVRQNTNGGDPPSGVGQNTNGVDPPSEANGQNASNRNPTNIPLRVISPPDQQITDGVDGQDGEREPLMHHQDSNESGPQSDGDSGAVRSAPAPNTTRRNSFMSSLHVLPENVELPSTSSENFVLPDWCLNDGARVTTENISQISGLIGNKGVLIAPILGLSTGEIENIEHNHKMDLTRQNFEILKEWVNRKGVNATKKKLAKALVAVGRAQEAAHLWPDRDLKSVTLASQNNSRFWQRRQSSETHFKLETKELDKMDWKQRSTWHDVTKSIRDEDCGDYEQLSIVCGIVEYVLLKPHNKFKPLKTIPSLSDNSDLEVDNYATTLINPDLQTLTAIKVAANGNCLFSAASIIAYGSADHCCELRLRIMIELCYHEDYYREQEALTKCIRAEYALNKTKDDDTLSDTAIEEYYERCVRDTLKECEPFSLQGNSIQLFGLASVLGCKIQSVYPTIGATEQSPLNVLIPPRSKKIKNPATSFLMWSTHTQIGEGESFLPNHFVPLLKRKKPKCLRSRLSL